MLRGYASRCVCVDCVPILQCGYIHKTMFTLPCQVSHLASHSYYKDTPNTCTLCLQAIAHLQEEKHTRPHNLESSLAYFMSIHRGCQMQNANVKRQ